LGQKAHRLIDAKSNFIMNTVTAELEHEHSDLSAATRAHHRDILMGGIILNAVSVYTALKLI
jgi:hypothetical protein